MTKKETLIQKIITVCGRIDDRDVKPSDPEPEHSYDDVQVKAVRMLTMKQLNKLLKEYQKKLWSTT